MTGPTTRQRISIADIVNDHSSSPGSSSFSLQPSTDNKENTSPTRLPPHQPLPTPTSTPSPKVQRAARQPPLWRQTLLDPAMISPDIPRAVDIGLPCGHARTVRAEHARIPACPARLILMIVDTITCADCGFKAGLEAVQRFNDSGTVLVMTRSQVSRALSGNVKQGRRVNSKVCKGGRRREAAARKALDTERDQERLRKVWLENWQEKRNLLGDAERVKKFFGERAVLSS